MRQVNEDLLPGPAVTLLLCAILALAPAGPAAAGAGAPVTIRVSPAGVDGLWRAKIRFAREVERFVFHREGGGAGRFQRAPAWRVETPGYALTRDGHREGVALAPGGRPRREVTIAFPVDASHPEKDYQLFERFSDGGLLLYTGHLNVLAVAGAPLPPHRFVLEPRRGEHVIVDGRLSRKRTEWKDTAGEGTYVYYGRLAPLRGKDVTAVLDPALPSWMKKRLHEAVPRLFADYSRLFGAALDTRPTLLVSFQPAADPRTTSWKGGTLPGLIQMHLEVAADAPEDAPLLRRFFKFLAHEGAHMWNGQLFHGEGRPESWMHEGSADAFAWRAMRREGLLDDAGLDERQAEDLSACLARLGPQPVRSAEEKGDFAAVYTCGSALSWLTEALVARAEPPGDLHAFWAELFRRAAARERRYDVALYFDVLRARGAGPEALAFVDAFLHQEMPDRVERTRAAFAAAGVALEPRPVPAGQKQLWGERALMALMRHDCDGRYSFTRRGGFRINGDAACRTLKHDLAVDALDGHRLGAEGDAAYDALAARCAAGEPVKLTPRGGGEPVTVPCSQPLSARTPWLAVVRAPAAP